MSSVLLVGSGGEEAKRLQAELRREGFTLFLAPAGPQAFQVATARTPDLAVWDLVPGDIPGLEEVKELGLPVVGLVAEAELHRVASLGLADFALKPLRPGEVTARIQALLARSRGRESGDVLESGDLVMDLTRYKVTVDGRLIDLAFMEFKLLQFLLTRRGRVFSRETLLDQVWGYDYYGGNRTVDVHIRRLRSKLEDASHSFIETVRNVGYRFRA